MAGIQKYNFFSNTYIFARGGVYIHWEFHFPPRLQTFVETPVLVLIEISSFQAVFSIVNGYFEISSFQVARGCLCLGTEIANSPCSWCAGNMSPLACRRGTVVTCSRAIYPTVAPLQVRRRPSPRGFDCGGLARSFRGSGLRCARTGAARL